MAISGSLVLGAAIAGAALAGGVGLGFVVVAAMSDDDSDGTRVTRVIDGDTVEIDSGEHVRLIGIDTPERGECGSDSATRTLRRMVEGKLVDLQNPTGVQDRDRYDRLLRYVELPTGRDTGMAQLKAGLADARYDSRDGYDPHPRESRYRSADRRASTNACREDRDRLRQRREEERLRARWAEARRVADRADINIRAGERPGEVISRARTVLEERRRLAELAQEPPPPPAAPEPAPPAPAPPTPEGFSPPPGWTTDALTPGYNGCRQGYPGGKINGVYVWKPIDC